MSVIFKAFQREASLIAEQMAYGSTLISKTNYAIKGRYLQLFFALSTSYERASKLILIISEFIEKGIFPPQKTIRRYGHNLNELFQEVKQKCENLELKEFSIPDSDIHKKIITILSDFATIAL